MVLALTLLPRINKRIAKYTLGRLSGLSKTRKRISDALIRSGPYGAYMCQGLKRSRQEESCVWKPADNAPVSSACK